MCGMPQRSRSTSTLSLRPGGVSSPSIVARTAFALRCMLSWEMSPEAGESRTTSTSKCRIVLSPRSSQSRDHQGADDYALLSHAAAEFAVLDANLDLVPFADV